MMAQNPSIDVFFALLRAGLWEDSIQLSSNDPIDFEGVYNLADEQSVVGLVAAGLEHVEGRKIAKMEVIPFMQKVLYLEQRNHAMNALIGELVLKMREAGIHAVLVKGQGIAQCYFRPQWRASGDVDFFLDAEDYEKAKEVLTPMADSVEPEGISTLHYGVTIDSWVVELHGTLRCELSSRMDRVIDEVQRDTFAGGQVRVWRNGETDINLPCADNDVVFIFTHFLKHFYKGGLGLRQICDWCRLMWAFRSELDVALLEKRLRAMGLTSEWKAFSAFAVEYLGMDKAAIPLYSDGAAWKRKASRILQFILMSGNFGYNRGMSYYRKYPYVVRKAISFGRRLGDVLSHTRIFPADSLRFLPGIVVNGLRSAAKGE